MRQLAITCVRCGTANLLIVEGILSPEEIVHCSRCSEQLGKIGKLDAEDHADLEEQRAIAC